MKKNPPTYTLHGKTPRYRPVLRPAHGHPAHPPARFETCVHRSLLHCAIFQCRPSNLCFPLLVALDHFYDFFLVALRGELDFPQWRVGGPQMRVASIGIQRLRWDLRRWIWIGRRRWRCGRSGRGGLRRRGFRVQEGAEVRVEITERISAGVGASFGRRRRWRGFGTPEPAHSSVKREDMK